ncbi:crystallin, gamma MX, like 2 [Brienomyrus brachyistius]|uniref:crystallin, gamma MX, like 2 n=1 Tax=Brienomyrus brachyistius TaxID=42636 RepID=UPI0020B31C38|nr:crystallin, gamma MX, like 2 [Brienomyrus brachyistius]
MRSIIDTAGQVAPPAGTKPLRAHIRSVTQQRCQGTDHQSCTMGKIIFYEGHDFQGRYYECTSDCMDTFQHFSSCNSIRVMGGNWVLYEKPHYCGYQYVLNPGEYSHFHSWAGFSNCIRSCRLFPPYHGSYRMRLYHRPHMMGHYMDLTDDCPSMYPRFHCHDVSSCHVTEGYWVFYEHPNYRGRQYFLWPGEYRTCRDWDCYNTTVGSCRRVWM